MNTLEKFNELERFFKFCKFSLVNDITCPFSWEKQEDKLTKVFALPQDATDESWQRKYLFNQFNKISVNIENALTEVEITKNINNIEVVLKYYYKNKTLGECIFDITCRLINKIERHNND